MEVCELSGVQLDALIFIYYMSNSWRRGLTPEIEFVLTPEVEFLAECDLLSITSLSRKNDSVVAHVANYPYSHFLPGPSTAHCHVVVTAEGEKFVERVDLSRRADACALSGLAAVTWCFMESLSTKELPEFLSSSHVCIRDAATERLRDCLSRTPTENFPELLTDSDPTVRATASAALNSHTHST